MTVNLPKVDFPKDADAGTIGEYLTDLVDALENLFVRVKEDE